MDLWGAGCVMFEITSLYPLFPGSNETDQITRIHKVLGTPSAEVLQKFKSKGANHISFDFPMYKGVGFPQLIPHASADAIDLLVKLLKYDAAERITAREAMRHAYFRDIRESEVKKMTNGSINGIDGVKNEVNSSARYLLTPTHSPTHSHSLTHSYSPLYSLTPTHHYTHSLTLVLLVPSRKPTAVIYPVVSNNLHNKDKARDYLLLTVKDQV